MKNKFLIISTILTLAIVIGGALLLSKKEKSSESSLTSPTSYEYYWSETCPHCANVNNFMDSWEGKDKVQIDKYEVDTSANNQQRFWERGTYCNYPRQELGVPFLVTPDGLCIAGDQPIINHFKSLGLTSSSNP